MEPIVIMFAQGLVFIVGAVAALAVIALGTRVLWRLTDRVKPRNALTVSPADFQRIETAIDAMAVEVERISEAQRYTVALLSERVQAGQPDRDDALVVRNPLVGSDTPH